MGVRTGTVRVVVNGEVRLSPDLIISPYFLPIPHLEIKEIELKSCTKDADGAKKVYYSNPRAKAGRISLGKVLQALGIERGSVKDKEFPATKKGKSIVIKMGYPNHVRETG